MSRSLLTRILHAALAVAVLHQLVVSWFMEQSGPGRILENLAFEFHEVVGLASLGLLGLFWLWALLRRREHGLADLLPWFSANRRHRVLQDIRRHARELSSFRLPDPGEETPLASAVHGLGLLTATAMAATGGVIFVTMGQDGSLAGPGRVVLDLHSMLASVMWAYLVGHAVVALVHQAAGHRVLDRMFLGK